MMSVIFSFALFVSVFLIGVACIRNRFFVGGRISTLVYVLVLGGLVDVSVVYWIAWLPGVALSGTALALYVLLSVVAIIVSMTPLLGDDSPSSRILLYVVGKQKVSAREINTLFSYDGLVGKRIDDMVSQKWVMRQGKDLFVLPAGIRIAVLINWYRSMLGLNGTG